MISVNVKVGCVKLSMKRQFVSYYCEVSEKAEKKNGKTVPARRLRYCFHESGYDAPVPPGPKVTVLAIGSVICPVHTGSTKKPLTTPVFQTKDPPHGNQRPNVPSHAYGASL